MKDRLQIVTNEKITYELLDKLSTFCDEFLIHAVDVEGKSNGIEQNLVTMLGKWGKIPITYAGGVHNFQDLEMLKLLGQDRINVTIGSALDLFGGNMNGEEVVEFITKL